MSFSNATFPAFAYWEGSGPMPPIVELCLDSVRRHHPNLQVLNPESIRAMGGGEVLDITARDLIQHRSDLLRFWLMKTFGGLWFDSDVICLRGTGLDRDVLAPSIQMALCRDARNWKKKGNKVPCGFHFAVRKGAVADTLYAQCLESIRSQSGVYNAPSCGVLLSVLKSHRRAAVVRNHEMYCPLPWGRFIHYLDRSSDPTFAAETRLQCNPAMFHLGGYIIHTLGAFDRQQLLESSTYVGFLLRRAFALEPVTNP